MNTTKTYRNFFIFMTGTTIISGIVTLICPVVLNLWNSHGASLTVGKIGILCLITVAALLLELILILVREQFACHYNQANFENYLMKFLHLKYDFLLEKGASNLLQRIQQAVNCMYNYMTGDVFTIWSNLLIVFVSAILMLLQIPVAGLVMLLELPIELWGYKILNQKLMSYSKQLQENSAKAYSQILSYIENIDYLKQCHTYEVLLKQLKPSEQLLYQSMRDVNIVARGGSQLLHSAKQIIQMISLALAVYQVSLQKENPLLLLMATIFIPLFFQSLSAITNANLRKSELMVSKAFLKELNENIENSFAFTDLKEISSLTIHLEQLVLHGKILAKEIHGEYQKGDTVWIKGPSGTGKSTLVKLLIKFRNTDGTSFNNISFNGISLSSLDPGQVRSLVSYLPQSTPIVEGTLRENLFFNRSYSPHEEELLLQSGILSTLLAHKSFDSPILENGSNLSGGEKQRIALARAFLEHPDVLILDEVTSSLDQSAATQLLNLVLQDSQNRITFIISHDSLPAQYAGKILNLTP